MISGIDEEPVSAAQRAVLLHSAKHGRGPKAWLVGENNPYNQDPRFDLYCEPPESAGGRLCRLILAVSETDYVRSFVRINLLRRDRWSAPAARSAASDVEAAMGAGDVVVLLGRKVWEAWHPKKSWRPFEVEGRTLALPHPSGLCRLWNELGSYCRARAAVLRIAPWLAGTVQRHRPIDDGAGGKICAACAEAMP